MVKLQVKVKLTLEQTTNDRRGRRGKAILFLNLLKPTGYVMNRHFNIKHFYILPTLYLCVLYLSQQTATSAPYTYADRFL